MKKWFRRAIVAVVVVAVLWTILTVWVDSSGKSVAWDIGDATAPRTAMIVFDPDPIYNLDEQVCKAFADGLAEQDFRSTVVTVAAAEGRSGPFDLYVLCANTYNWRPDAAITAFVECRDELQGAKVVAITLGSGSTEEAQRVFESHITAARAELIASRSFWLLRPNDEARLEERNVDVAIDMARQWGASVGMEFKATSPKAQ